MKKERPTTEDIRDSGKQLFSIADASKYDAKIYLADNFTQLSDEFNDNLQTIIKQLNKKLSQREYISILTYIKCVFKSNKTIR